MKCKCGSDAVYRVIVVTPSNLPYEHAAMRGKSWVIFFCVKCLPFEVK